MRNLSISDAKVGMLVKLRFVACEWNEYSIDETNPAMGTPYECEGEIIDVDPDQEILVRWNNGEENCYVDNDLVLLGKTSCVSIW